jgi:hypothetical protein
MKVYQGASAKTARAWQYRGKATRGDPADDNALCGNGMASDDRFTGLSAQRIM